MATITPSVNNNPGGDNACQLVTYASMANGDTGAPAEFGDWGDRCVQVSGTFGSGGTATIQGSNDGTNWATLNNAQGTALAITTAAIKQIVETPRYVRPNITAGDGTTSLTVSFLVRRHTPLRT